MYSLRLEEMVCVCKEFWVFWRSINPFSSVQFSSFQSLSHVCLFVTPWIAACQASCPSPTTGVYSNSCPSSRWCYPAISSSVVPFSSCPQSLPASGSFPLSQLFTWGGQSIGVSALASFLPKMQIKTTMRYHLTLVRMAITRNPGEHAEKSEPSLLVGM